jgi:hypothetical protein
MGQPSGNMGNAGAGGYNPQPMQGAGNPFWSPYPDWNMRAGSGINPQANTQTAIDNTPGAPAWLQHQLGNYLNLPMYQPPNTYGRWNWGTNLQGQGIPSQMGQYAQQHATYPPPQFPPPPQMQPPPTGGPPPTTQPPPTTPPPPVVQPPTANLGNASDSDLYQLYAYGNVPGRGAATQQLVNRFGNDTGALNNWINSFGGGGSNFNPSNLGDFNVMQGLYSKYGLK